MSYSWRNQPGFVVKLFSETPEKYYALEDIISENIDLTKMKTLKIQKEECPQKSKTMLKQCLERWPEKQW